MAGVSEFIAPLLPPVANWLLWKLQRIRINPLAHYPKRDGRYLVKPGYVTLTGHYWFSTSQNVFVFHKRDKKYWSQGRLELKVDKTWEKRVYIGAPAGQTTVLVATLSDDLALLCKYYVEVHEQMEAWVPFTMHVRPSGFMVHDEMEFQVGSE